MSETPPGPDSISFESILQGVEGQSEANFCQEYCRRVELYRRGELSFDEFACWCEELIVEKRERARYWVEDCQPEIYLSFAKRAANRAHLAVQDLEEGLSCIAAFLDGGEDSHLDDAIPYLEAAVKGVHEVISLNDECLELSGGVTGQM
jgi:hypothetical protein